MDWLTVVSVFAGAAMLGYASRGKMVAERPSQRGLIIGMGLALLGSAGWFTFQRTAPKIDADTIFTALLIVLSIPLYGIMIAAPFARKKGGAILFEARLPQTRRYSGYATAALFFFLALITVIQSGLTGAIVTQMAFYVAVILYFASPLFGKVELRQEGMFASYSLFRWKDFVSHRWIGEDECSLIITTKSGWRKTATVVFPPDEKDTIETIIKEHV